MGSGDDLTERNRAVATALLEEAFTHQRFENVEALLGDYRLHVGSATLDLGPGDLEELVARWHAAFANFRFEIHQVLADREIAAVHATLHGEHVGEWRGLPPTGAPHAARHMFFIRFAEDRIVEVWELNDAEGLP